MGKPSQSTFQARSNAGRRWAVLAGCAGAVMLAAPAALAEGPKARTSDEASEQNLRGALLAPLRDVNLMKDEVPTVLAGAKEAPYLDPENASCDQLAQMIAPLDKALGPDTGDGAEVAKGGVGTMVYGAVADVTRDAIPFRGVVRRLTGAAAQDQKVRETRQAGNLRRAYLKGFASAKGCYGPPQQETVHVDAAPAAPIVPPVLTVAPPITVATLDLPPTTTEPAAPAPPAEPRFNLPESWRVQVKGAAY